MTGNADAVARTAGRPSIVRVTSHPRHRLTLATAPRTMRPALRRPPRGVITADQGGADGQRAFHPGARHGRPASSRSPPLSARRASQGA